MADALPAPRRILVINVSRIGDTLLATPALRALAAAWPQARITFLGHPKRAEIMRHLPFVAEVGGVTKYRTLLRGWLPGERFDLAVVYGFDEPLVAYALRVAERVVAFRQDDEALNTRLYCKVERPPFQSQHAVLNHLLLTRAVGVADAGLRLAYEVTEGERVWASGLVAKIFREKPNPLVGLQVASFPTKGYRDWPVDSFIDLCARIMKCWPGARFALLGGDLELDRIRELAAQLQGRVAIFAGTLSLRQSAALMSQLDLYVGVDTGPTHIMGALEPPMVALYHCHSPSRLLGPLERPRCYVVDHPRAGAGCAPETPMAEITVDTVWARVQEALAAL